MDWPTDRTPIPLSQQGKINAVYTATCPTPGDPMIVWGTHVDVEHFRASLHRASTRANVLISPAHALLWAVARSLVEHPHLNRRVIGRRVHQLRDVNLLIPVLDRRRHQVEVVLIRRMQDMSLADVARTLWSEARAKMDPEVNGFGKLAPSSWKQTRWGKWLRLAWIHYSVLGGFRIHNRFRLPNLGFNDEFNAASGMVNYLVFPGAPVMGSFKPSSLPANMGQLNVTMGRAEQQAVVDGEGIVIRKLAPLFVRFDHRIGYTHQFAELIATLQRHLREIGNTLAANEPLIADAQTRAA